MLNVADSYDQWGCEQYTLRTVTELMCGRRWHPTAKLKCTNWNNARKTQIKESYKIKKINKLTKKHSNQ